ncbi:hypothetical protein [Streptomyces sp. NPDC055709]
MDPRKRVPIRGRAAVTLGLAAALTTVAGLAAAPASAGTNCEGGYHCVFYFDFNSAKHGYFTGDPDFSNDTFNQGGSSGRGTGVNNNVWAASNSSTGGYYSLYYYNTGRTGPLVFCVRPGSQVGREQLATNNVAGDGIGQRDEASSLELRDSGWIPGGCF